MEEKRKKQSKRKTLGVLLGVAAVLVIAVLIFFITMGRIAKTTTPLNLEGAKGYSEEKQREELAEPKEGLCLAHDGECQYVIVYPDEAEKSLIEAAVFLKETLSEITGDETVKAVKESKAKNIDKKKLHVGNTERSEQISLEEVKDDGYRIQSKKDTVFIKGLTDAASANGIYGFLEDYLECMFVTNDYDYIPNFPTIYLGKLDEVNNPSIAWRRFYQYEVAQDAWHVKLRNNGVELDSESQSGAKNASWGTWCHNVFTFVDPDLYFKEHPEYFAYVNGERRCEYKGMTTQLCLSNPEIYPIIEDKMGELMAENPEALYWDFSVNDNEFYCRCKDCKAVYKETGSKMGTLLPIINQLAKKYPDKMISTLAYWYAEDVPNGAKCEPNVNITVAPIRSSQAYSYKQGGNTSSKKAQQLIQDWSEVCDSILVWDYVVDFKHLLLPYPNYDVQSDNISFYVENNVRALFHQGSREHTNEMACMRAYLLSRQMWDQDMDMNETMSKYLTVTYGDAAPHLEEYFDQMSARYVKRARNLDLYDEPWQHMFDYLSPGAIKSYMEYIEQAKLAAGDDAVLLERLEKIEMNILYAKMTEVSWDVTGKTEAFETFQALVQKYEIDRQTEVTPPDMEEYIKVVYPAHLKNVQISLYVFYGVVLLLVIALLILGVRRYRIRKLGEIEKPKKRKRKKKNES